MRGDRVELDLAGVELVNVFLDAAVLLAQALDQRPKLGIHRALFRLIELNAVDRLHQPAHHAGGKQHGGQERQRQRGQEPPDQVHQHAQRAVSRVAQAQVTAVREPGGIVIGLFAMRVRVAEGVSTARLRRLDNFLAGKVILHAGGGHLAVIEHRAVLRDPCQALGKAGLGQRRQVLDRVILAIHRQADLHQVAGKLLFGLRAEKIEQHDADQCAEQQRGQQHGDERALQKLLFQCASSSERILYPRP